MNDPADAVLVEACLNGRKEAYADLVRRYQDSVYGLAMSMTKNPTDAADMAQEAFTRAYFKLRLYDPAHSFRNWVMSICANLTKNRFRSHMRRRQAEETHLERSEPVSKKADPRREVLMEAMFRIPENLRIPLNLKYVEDLAYDEIADVMNIGVSAAKMRVKRARDLLARFLRPERGTGKTDEE